MDQIPTSIVIRSVMMVVALGQLLGAVVTSNPILAASAAMMFGISTVWSFVLVSRQERPEATQSNPRPNAEDADKNIMPNFHERLPPGWWSPDRKKK